LATIPRNTEVTDDGVACPARARGFRGRQLAAWVATRQRGWLWGPIVLLLWVALIATVVWFLARSARPSERSGVERAREVLAERYARGELTTEEYQERLEQLR
jgi:putative membrane protein